MRGQEVRQFELVKSYSLPNVTDQKKASRFAEGFLLYFKNLKLGNGAFRGSFPHNTAAIAHY